MQFAALEGQQKELAAALEDPAAYSPGGHTTVINRHLCAVSTRSRPSDDGMGRRHGEGERYLTQEKVESHSCGSFLPHFACFGG